MRASAFLLGVVTFFCLIEPALAQVAPATLPPAASPPDVFPAWLGYSALGVFTTVGTTLGGVIGKLYYGQEKRELACQQAIEAVRKECRGEIESLRVQLFDQQRARLGDAADRREETERLLREQKDILREVLTASTAMAQAFSQNTESTKTMTDRLEKLVERVEKLAEKLADRRG